MADGPELPKSTSSAMPDPHAESVPRLKAKVHKVLPAARCAQIPVSSLRYRALDAQDHDEVVALHTEWFPLTYDQGFYEKCVKGEIFTLAATHLEPQGEEHIVGIVTMSTCAEHYRDDLPHVLGKCQDPACDGGDEGALEQGVDQNGVLAYILTLGVIDGFRRRGVASEMLKQSIRYVEEQKPSVQAVYLHVVTYNHAAIQLYESLNFLRIAHFPRFYHLHGKPYDSFLYSLYVNGCKAPWKFRLKQFFSFGFDWVRTAWSSIWAGDSARGAESFASPDRGQPGQP